MMLQRACGMRGLTARYCLATLTASPQTEPDAYAIQADMIAISGRTVTGWKIGATTAAMRQILAVSDSVPGPLFEAFTYPNGTKVSMGPGYLLETEFSLCLKAPLACRDEAYSRAEVEQAMGSVHPSFELVGLRFGGPPDGSGCRLIADGGGNAGLILGEGITDWSGLDLEDHPASLTINGEPAAQGRSSDLLWEHIFDAASWLVRHRALAGRGLLAGDVIMTGTCTGIRPLTAGDHVAADFGALGKVSASFV